MSSNLKNIFVIFAPGGGGSHLANLISTDKNFTSRFDVKDYYDNTNTAHYANQKSLLQKDKIDLKKILKSQGVYHSHLHSFLGFGFAKVLKKQFVILTMPELHSKGFNRMKSLFPTYNSHLIYEELKWLYTTDNLSKFLNINEPCIEINGQDLFEDENFIDNLATKCKDFGLSIDKNMCYETHRVWLSKIFKNC